MSVSDSSSRILAQLLEARTGQQLTESRRWRIESALSGLVRERGWSSVEDLAVWLTQPQQGELAQECVEALLNNETSFFRDRAMFDLLSQQVLPGLARQRAATRRIRIWSVGCSTGQEAVSLAILFAEQKARWAGWTIDIVGTDVSHTVIEFARNGLYPAFQVQRGLGVLQMLNFFTESTEGWLVSDEIRQMIRFKVHNLLEPPVTGGAFDLVLCRNVLLYFGPYNRARAFTILADAMAPDGRLMLGGGETVVGQTERLIPDTVHQGLFSRVADATEQFASKPAAR